MHIQTSRHAGFWIYFPGHRRLTDPRLKAQVTSAAEALARGDVVVFPTDTFFALGGDALNLDAIQRVFRLKVREQGRPLPVLLPSLEAMHHVSDDVPDIARSLAERFWPGQLTIVIPRSRSVPVELVGGGATVGVRVPDHPIALEIIRSVDKPIIGTSANPSGMPPTKDPRQIHSWFRGQVPVIVDAECGPHRAPSTVLDLTTQTPTVVREGSVSTDSLRELIPGVIVRPPR